MTVPSFPPYIYIYTSVPSCSSQPKSSNQSGFTKVKTPVCSFFNIAVSTAAFTVLKLWTIGYQDVATPHYWAIVELQESRHLAGPPETLWMNTPSILMFMTHGCLRIKAIGSPCSVSLFLSCVCVLDTHTCVRAHLCVYTCNVKTWSRYQDSPSFSKAESPIQI